MLKQKITAFSKLGKFSISLPVSLTTFTGYILFQKQITADVAFPVIGVFLLASAASALNQVQEKHTDEIMPRTSRRPIPAGIISVNAAVLFSVLLGFAGIFIIYSGSGVVPAVLGLLNFFWYNGIYTPLKQRTAFAVVPGGVVGSLPPLIGYTAAGGEVMSPAAIGLAFFFFMGQVPHFWLLLLRFGHEYEMAGLKSLTTRFSCLQIRRMTFVWVAATAVSAFLLPVYYRFTHSITLWFVWIISISLTLIFIRLLRPDREEYPGYRSSFLIINLYYFLIMLSLCSDALIHS